jgi:hypothetical protein
MALNPKVTIELPPEVLEAIKESARASGSTLTNWMLFSFLRSLKDDNFTWDLRQSQEYLDSQMEL